MITITLFKNIYDKSGVQICGEFKEIVSKIRNSNRLSDKEREGDLSTAKLYNKCFIRTGCNGARKDSNCDEGSKLIVIDMDKGTRANPKPWNVSQVLIEMNINHFIYTSWSNMVAGEPKYRILIPTNREYKKNQLKSLNAEILRILAEHGQGDRKSVV